MSLIVCGIVIFALYADQPKGYIQRVALGVLAFMFFGVSLGHFSFLANDRLGAPLQLSLLLCIELNDVFAYCTGKAGMHMMTRAIHLELAEKGIRVFGFQPGEPWHGSFHPAYRGRRRWRHPHRLWGLSHKVGELHSHLRPGAEVAL
jgi:NAD(P)-dependent dehydrogenase (short-subunit alcohol dehydrogenase family)